jgi:serine/threonine-protein kinase RsbW
MMSLGGDGSGRSLELKIESHPANVARVRRAVEKLCGCCGFDEASLGEVGLCVNEALANVICHAYAGRMDQPIVVAAQCRDDTLRITIRDWGTGVDPCVAPPPQHDPLTPGGVGLICLRELMDSIEFVPQEQGMLLVMQRSRHSVRRRRTRDVG